MILTIPDMSCGHCRASVVAALTALDQGAQVVVDLDRRQAEVTTVASADAVIAALDAVGFPAQTL
jgi:copper chaperone